ncbi:hypothetical protein JW824_05645 [bacterium]|nr:hypothetical protein [bacterium]RQV96360.1 MAG: hypothetical protein EH221_05155 [bacterium]
MISTLYTQRGKDDPEAHILLRRLRSEGFLHLRNLFIEKVFRLEGINQQQALKLTPLFCHPITENISPQSALRRENGPILEVGYQRAVTDPELFSILRSAQSLGVEGLIWVRIAHRYQFQGVDRETAEQIVSRYFYNPQVQIVIASGETWDTLRPQGESGPVEEIILERLSQNELLQISQERRLFLDANQMTALQHISHRMGRSLTDAELEMFAQTWSDHCFHTTWKSLGLLQQLWDTTNQIHHPLVISVFEDNAGAMTFYDEWAITIKGETHNSPSAISPYGGIMTKHGGVIRDTLGCGRGAWPIGGSTIMGLGNPQMKWTDVPRGALHPKTILAESIRGTADYNNPMGIPMMFPVYRFHHGYTGKCFALGHSLGIVPEDRAQKGSPQPGDFAVLIGGLTGRDGLHGATVSSSSMTSRTSTMDAAHVQIGHPIEERKFMEAIPVLRDRDCLRAITDLGAAGLSSAAGEMGAKTGVWINLAWVPLKTEGLHPWEIWISESQERMLLCIPKDKIEEAFEILEHYEVRGAIVGQFTNRKRCQVVFDNLISNDPSRLTDDPGFSGEKVVDLDFNDLRKGCPYPKIGIQKPNKKDKSFHPPPLVTKDQWISAIQSVLGHLNICDQSPAGNQFDNTVQGMVVLGPYGGKDKRMPNDIWACTPIRGQSYGVVASVAFNPFYGEVDPAVMAKLMIVESVSNLIAASVDQNDMVLCDNFYTPRVTPEIAWMLREMVSACCRVSKALGIPFISGKDSSSGTFIGEDGRRLDIPPTLAVMAMGRIPDVSNLIPKPWQKPGNKLYLVGPLTPHLGGSIYLDTLGERGDRLPDPSLDDFKTMWDRLKPLQKDHVIRSCSVLSEGGLIRRLFEMALGSGLGCRIDLSALVNPLGVQQPEIVLFAEMIGAQIIEVEEEACPSVENALNGICIGQVTEGTSLEIKIPQQVLCLEMKELIAIWEAPFRKVLL